MEIKALTSIRGIAAMWVLLLHFGPNLCTIIPQLEGLEPLYSQGYLGVDLFFVLSGFIISYVYSSQKSWDKKQFSKYIIKRIARIYPIHLVTLLILTALYFCGGMLGKTMSGNYSLLEFFYNVFLLQGMPFSDKAWNYPSWSVSVEFLGYLLIFPLTLVAFRYALIRQLSLFISFFILGPYILSRELDFFPAYKNIIRISCEFFSGAALYFALIQNLNWKRYLSMLLIPSALLVVMVSYFPSLNFLPMSSSSIAILMVPIIIGGLSYDRGRVCEFLGTKPLRYLGLISYSLYMCHAIVEKVFKILLPCDRYADADLLVRFLVCALYIVSPIVFAAILYQFVEEPARAWIVRTSSKDKIGRIT